MSPQTAGWDTPLESGLLDNFDGTIIRSWFATDDKYQGGNQMLIHWEIKTDDIDQPVIEKYYSVGKGWVSKDGGQTVEHESGNTSKNFQGSSMYGRILVRCRDDFGMKDLMIERGLPFVAAIWNGLSFHFQTEELQFGSGLDARSAIMPNRFLGVGAVNGSAGAAPGTPATAPAATGLSAAEQLRQSRANQQAAAVANAGEDELLSQVKSLAKAHDSFTSFQDAALGLDGVDAREDIVSGLIEESGIYAQARAEG
jgi:hypothetical protein